MSSLDIIPEMSSRRAFDDKPKRILARNVRKTAEELLQCEKKKLELMEKLYADIRVIASNEQIEKDQEEKDSRLAAFCSMWDAHDKNLWDNSDDDE